MVCGGFDWVCFKIFFFFMVPFLDLFAVYICCFGKLFSFAIFALEFCPRLVYGAGEHLRLLFVFFMTPLESLVVW